MDSFTDTGHAAQCCAECLHELQVYCTLWDITGIEHASSIAPGELARAVDDLAEGQAAVRRPEGALLPPLDAARIRPGCQSAGARLRSRAAGCYPGTDSDGR